MSDHDLSSAGHDVPRAAGAADAVVTLAEDDLAHGGARGVGLDTPTPGGSAAAPGAAASHPARGGPAATSAMGTETDLPTPVGRRLRSLPDRSGPRMGWAVRRMRSWWFDPGRQGALLLVALALAAAVVVAYLTWQHRTAAQAVSLAPPAARASAQPRPGATATRSLVVAVAGKVRQPGIVTLPAGARVIDAIRAAGGVAPGADAGLINLARPLADGEQVVVGLPPGSGCPGCAGGGGGAEGSGGGAASDAVPPGTGPVNLNAATTGELDALPGVGPVTAGRIIDWRRAHGRFDTVDQLREVDGIGPAKFERLRARVVV